MDTTYSFFQHLSMPLDGDMPAGILQTNEVKKILSNPFGIDVITRHEIRPNPNRFFAHLAFSEYFRSIPFVLQRFFSPINSIYISCAIFKTILQILLIYLLACYISGTRAILTTQFLIPVILITPLFQANGYQGSMGIINSATTYSFFYALPIAFLLLLFLPFFNTYFHGQKKRFNMLNLALTFFVAIIVSFSGPLIPPTVCIVSVLILSSKWLNNFKTLNISSFILKCWYAVKQIPKLYFMFLLPVAILSMYSFYIGTFNSINYENNITLLQRYAKLPMGIFETFTNKIGFPLLILMLIVNAYLIRKYYNSIEGQKILTILKWIIVFVLIYILLLPLGGYRSYRPNTIRCDTIIPVTLSLFFIYGISTYYIIRNQRTDKKWYVASVIVCILIFTLADGPGFDKNACEKDALRTIAASPEKIVFLQNDCTVIDWQKITDPINSKQKCELLKYWGVINEDKLYYQK